jgi:threonine aldolase
MTRKSFGSDNHAPAHPHVMRAVFDASVGDAIAYGADEWTVRATGALKREFRTEGDVFFVFNGSGANVLGLSALLGRHEAVICAESAHINTDECGSAERLLGTKLLAVPSPDGKITLDGIAAKLAGRGDEHFAQPGVVALTQATEYGTCYGLEELRKISEFCHSHDLRVFIDGARLANAAVHLECDLAEIASYADALSFGGTKNGGMAAEALVIMRPEYVANVKYLRKQQTQLASKMRFVSAQFDALLTDGLWRTNAAHANAMATRLADGVSDVPGIGIVQSVQANAVFARLPGRQREQLQQEWFFHTWDETTGVVRWMTAFDTTEEDVDAFIADIKATSLIAVCIAVDRLSG